MLSRALSPLLCALLVISPTGDPARRTAEATPPSLTNSSVPGGGVVPVPYRAPVRGVVSVVDPFRAPASQYGPGHRGVDLATPADAAALAAAAGRVTFAGTVATRGLVVLVHADGLSTEYEPIEPAVRVGQVVVAGQRIGTVTGTHRDCPPRRCLHWGARSIKGYLDPMSLVAVLDPVRLLPW